MDKLKRIMISGKTYPMKCDLNVLEALQEEFGSVNEFERQLLGIRFKKDEEGKQLYTKDGDPQMYIVEPSIKAIKTALPLMINEGLAIEAARKGAVAEQVEELDIIAGCDISFELLSRMIHEEYKKCFVTKK